MSTQKPSSDSNPRSVVFGPVPDDKRVSIEEFLFKGERIQAIKIYRDCTNVGLAEAKAAVEQLERELRVASPGKFTAPSRGGGCLGLVAVLCAVITVVIVWTVSS